MDEDLSSLPKLNPQAIKRMRLDLQCVTEVRCADRLYQISFKDGRLRIARDESNYAEITLTSQHVAYKATILGGFAQAEISQGQIDYHQDFDVAWEDDQAMPEIILNHAPREICRRYKAGSWIELRLAQARVYLVRYADGVEARFFRKGPYQYRFLFSTGFQGSVRERKDGSYTITFKGDQLIPGEDHYHAQSKFIVTRSKYSGNLLLMLQEEATVWFG